MVCGHPEFKLRFQSTLPARGATITSGDDGDVMIISIHTPREGSDFDDFKTVRSEIISIHTPREGSDIVSLCFGATRPISIHTPREGSDQGDALSLRGLRPFQSTLPARGATSPGRYIRAGSVISIHTPREGSDL